MSSFLTRRAGFWHFARCVPQSLTALDRSGFVRQSTKIRIADDAKGTRAKQVAESFNRELEAYWRGLAAGQATESKNRYDAALVRGVTTARRAEENREAARRAAMVRKVDPRRVKSCNYSHLRGTISVARASRESRDKADIERCPPVMIHKIRE